MATAPEVYLTAKQAREPFHLSESGLRAAVARGDFPAPIAIGSKRLWARSRIEAWEKERLEHAAAREQQAKGCAEGSQAPVQAVVPAPVVGVSLKRMGRPRGSKNRPKAA